MRCFHRLAALAAACGLVSSYAWALSEGKTAQGDAFVMGGAVDTERVSMRQDRKKYSLWIQTDASVGSSIPDATVHITTRGGVTVLDTRMTGPWLFVKLGAGEYSVAVTSGTATETRRTFIHAGDHTEMLFFFQPAMTRLPGATQ